MDKKITQLTQVTELTGAELLPLAQGGVTKSASVDQLRGYKVYTALLTQSGGSVIVDINYDDDPRAPIIIGTTYTIIDNAGGADFTNIGATNNEIGTSFVAIGVTPNSWGTGILRYNEGAPIVTVLENTIGNIWFTYLDVGQYLVNCDGLFTADKTTVSINTLALGRGDGSVASIVYQGNSSLQIETGTLASIGIDGTLFNTPIEIRVYN
jgi:hypothetical protein